MNEALEGIWSPRQLDAKVVTMSSPQGTTVSVTHATFATKEIRAA